MENDFLSDYELLQELNISYVTFEPNTTSSNQTNRWYPSKDSITLPFIVLPQSYMIFNMLKLVHSSLIVILNALLLYFLIQIGSKKRRITNHCYFVCNFAVADFMVGVQNIFNCATFITLSMNRRMEIVHHCIFKFLVFSSLFLFLSHAFVQWYSIRNPLKTHTVPLRFICLLTFGSWFCAIFMTALNSSIKFRTDLEYNNEYIYYKYFELSVYMTCSMAICGFYVLVLLKIRHKNSRASNVAPENRSSTKRISTELDNVYVVRVTSNVSNVDGGLRANCVAGRRLYDPRKVTLTSLTVAAVHVACFIPYVAFYVYYFSNDPNDKRGRLLKLYINGMVLTLRSLLLPVIFMRKTPEINTKLRHASCTRSSSRTDAIPNVNMNIVSQM